MIRAKQTSSRKRLSRSDWIAAARKVFVQGGVPEVKVHKLAARLKVTRGSFYWHFKSHQELLDTLLADWEDRNKAEVANLRATSAGDVRLIERLVELWLTQDPSVPAFDIALRGWARRSRHVAAVVLRIDDDWIDLLDEALQRIGHEKPESLIRARVFYFHQIGYARYALNAAESITDRIAVAPLYYKVFVGFSPREEFERALREIG